MFKKELLLLAALAAIATVLILCFPVGAVEPPLTLAAPQTTDSTVFLSWTPAESPGALYNVYRNGRKVNPAPLSVTYYDDSNRPPETPHTYTVEAVDTLGNVVETSNRVGATTSVGVAVLRVPEDYPTIALAVAAAVPGTSIHVAPGLYTGFYNVINLTGKDRVTVKCQDPVACIIDTQSGSTSNLDPTGGANTVSGFTLHGAWASAESNDTFANCIFESFYHYPGGILGGGFAVNSVLGTVGVNPGNSFMAANCIFKDSSPNPVGINYTPPGGTPGTAYLLNNDFLVDGSWTTLPGEGNFLADPLFSGAGAYTLAMGSPCIDKGVDVGLPFEGLAPDIGALEYGFMVSPRPPANLQLSWNLPAQTAHLTWTASPDADVTEYRIYRRNTDSFVPTYEPLPGPPLATIASTSTAYDDYPPLYAQWYYYQVRAFAASTSLVSAQTNTATVSTNRPPIAVNDSAVTNAGVAVIINVLQNDSDPDNQALSIVVISQPPNGTIFQYPDKTIRYTPKAGFTGTDTFTYTIVDTMSGRATATVSVFVNAQPTALDDAAATKVGIPVVISVLQNDSDPENQTLAVAALSSAPANGTAVLNADQTVTYTPNAGFSGVDTFGYTISDGWGGSDAALVTVTVTMPLFRITSISLKSSTVRSITTTTATVLAWDENNAPLSGVSITGHWSGLTSDVEAGSTGTNGTVVFTSNGVKNANGQFIFTVDTAVRSGYLLDAANSELSKALTYPPPVVPGVMHVAEIDMKLVTKKTTAAVATVKIVDQNGAPVGGAQVSGQWSGAVGGSSTALTDSAGSATLTSPGLKAPSGQTFVLTITDVGKMSWSYSPSENVETSDQITAP